MATFKCPDCKTKVSTSATACPKCGRPVTASDKQPKKPSKAKKLVVLLVCLVVAGAWLNARHPEGISPQKTETAKQNSPATPSNAIAPSKALSEPKLTTYLNGKMPSITASLQRQFGRDGGNYTIKWAQFGTEGGKMYAVQVTFSKSLQSEMIQAASLDIVTTVLDGMDKQGYSMDYLKKKGVMVVAGAQCKRSGKLVSYGVAVANPKNGNDIAWIEQYQVQE